MDIGGNDLELEGPTTPDTIRFLQCWWESHWPESFTEDASIESTSEIIVWINKEASRSNGENGYDCAHILVDPVGVTIVVEDIHIELGNECLESLKSARSKGEPV